MKRIPAMLGVGMLAVSALAPCQAAAPAGAADCVRFGLIASTMQADFLAGRSYRQAHADGLRLLGPEHPRQALIVERLARDIYTAPNSRSFSPQLRRQQVLGQCLQAAAAAGR